MHLDDLKTQHQCPEWGLGKAPEKCSHLEPSSPNLHLINLGLRYVIKGENKFWSILGLFQSNIFYFFGAFPFKVKTTCTLMKIC